MKAPGQIAPQMWPWSVRAFGSEERPHKRVRPRSRPDVGGYFTFILVSALTSGTLLVGDLVRLRVPLEQCLAFVGQHPLSYVLGCCVALLVGLLTIGDV